MRRITASWCKPAAAAPNQVCQVWDDNAYAQVHRLTWNSSLTAAAYSGLMGQFLVQMLDATTSSQPLPACAFKALLKAAACCSSCCTSSAVAALGDTSPRRRDLSWCSRWYSSCSLLLALPVHAVTGKGTGPNGWCTATTCLKAADRHCDVSGSDAVVCHSLGQCSGVCDGSCTHGCCTG